MPYQYDSRKIQKGDTFICLPGGEAYISEAKRRGAIECKTMTRAELAVLANQAFGAPSTALCVIGITGTNGKTTVASCLAQCLNRLGFKAAYQGTITGSLTTPESLDTQAAMAAHLANGGTHFVMEVSSHGIDQHRLDGIQFAIKLLTNISQDHLDYHKTFDAYKAVKLRFMTDFPGISIYPEDYKKQILPDHLPLQGRFNYENLQAVAAILSVLHVTDSSVLNTIKGPPGRFEVIDEGQPFMVIVDYAHTPDGLDRVLSSAKEIADKRGGRLLTMFGCGGDRDRAKRPLMTEVACRHSDFIVITQDNPRSEDPEQILVDILKGLPSEFKDYTIIQDRKEAIKFILAQAKPADVVVLAGKGHETVQILASGPVPFDEREIARKLLK